MRPDRVGSDQIWSPSPLRAAVRAAALIGVTAFCAVVQVCALRLKLPLARWLPQFWHRICCGLLAIDVRPSGVPETGGPVLYICNHASYLDVTVLAALLDARSQSDELRRALNSGASLVLFPEGTSSDGNRVLPFKSTLFSAADAHVGGVEVKVQPVTVAYSRHRGLPMGRRMRPYFAWYGDMTLIGHLWGCLGLGSVGVDVVFHEPVQLSRFASRKALAQHCHAQVARGLSDALSGRVPCTEAQAPIWAPPHPFPDWPGFALLETGHEM